MHQLTQYMLLLSIVHSCLRVSGITTDNMITTACVASDKDILFSFDLQNEGYAQKIWYVNSTAGTKIAQQIGTGPFIVQSGYSGRVSAYGSAGITLSSVTAADSGVYLLVIYTNITLSSGTASTTVSIFVGADASCKPSCSSDNNPRCMIPEACPAKGSVQVGWFLGQDRQSSDVTCTVNNYGKKYSVCAVGAAVTACYGGEPLCTDHTCTDTTTSICIGVLVPIGCCGIIFIILFCCGCLDCCLLCRIFPHYKTTKSCNATFYCRKKGCLECFFCKGSKEEKGILCCSASKDPEVPLEAETSNRQPSCLCCFCICCDPGQKEAVPLQLKRSRVVHTGTQNKVNSENTSIQKKSLDLPHHLPTLDRDIEDKPKHRPQPLPPGKNDVKDQHPNYDDTTGLANDMSRPSKLPPLLAGKQPIVKEAVDLEQPKKKKKKKKGQQDVKNPEEETGEEK